jgi:hypothetical protein
MRHDAPPPSAHDEEPPPIFATWGRLYAAILIWEVVVIVLIAVASSGRY